MKAKDRLKEDRKLHKLASDHKDVSAKYKQAVKVIAYLEKEAEAHKSIVPLKPYSITPTTNKGESEATAFVLLSDWHYEEKVVASSVSGLNEFNLVIAYRRIQQLFSTIAKMVMIFKKDIKIHHVVLFLGGDFITGNIHEENVETAQLQPIEAVIEVQKLIAGGIQYLLDKLPQHFTVICASGNHARITHKQRHATEQGNSLETFMYHALASSFKGNPRISFTIPDSYLSYLDVYDYRVCFHHGHNIRFQGGVGGLFIPAYKAIAQWNKAIRADLHCFGHWHSAKDGGSFLCNGSLIGYNAYALGIKADFEKPKQLFFLMDKLRGKTVVCPIVLD